MSDIIPILFIQNHSKWRWLIRCSLQVNAAHRWFVSGAGPLPERNPLNLPGSQGPLRRGQAGSGWSPIWRSLSPHQGSRLVPLERATATSPANI